MNRVRWTSRCAVMAVLIVIPAMGAHAQDDPFGFDVNSAVEQRALVDPAPFGEGAPAAERSLLSAEPVAIAEANRQDLCRCVGETNSTSVERIEEALRSSLKSNGLDFAETPLEEVVNLLQEDYGIPIQLDVPALDEIGLISSKPVTTNLHNISLRSALRLMLKQLQLTYVVRDEVLMITTPEAAESQLLTCVYDVRDMIDQRSSNSFDGLIDPILSCVATESWSENGGGEAEIRPLKPGLLVISQTQAVHEEIGGLLAAIRETRDERPPAANGGAAARSPDDDQVLTRSYLLQINQSGDPEKLRTQVRELIVQSIPEEQWDGRLDDGQPVVLSILPDRVVLRHRPGVHQQVQALLVDSGVAAPLTAEAGDTFGRGFGGSLGGGGGGFIQRDPAIDD